MRLYLLFRVLYQSFYSQSLYIEVGQKWKGLGFRYLFFLLTLCWGVAIVGWVFVLLSFDFKPSDIQDFQKKNTSPANIENIIAALIQQVPPITINNGQASLDVPQPYTIYLPGSDVAFAIIDTTGETKAISNDNIYVLLTKEQLHIKKDAQNTEIHSLADMEDMIIDHSTLYDWANLMKRTLLWGLPLLFYPIAVCISFFWCILLTSVYGLIALVMTNLFNVSGFSFQDCFRLAAVASTPVIIISTITHFVPFFGAFTLQNGLVNIVPLPSYGIMGIVAMIAYLLFAVMINAQTKEAS